VKISGSVYQRKDSGKWGAALRVAGRRFRQETGFATKTSAKRALQGWQSELLVGRYVAKENEKLSVADLLDSYERDLRNRSAKSMVSFRAHAKALLEGPAKGRSKERKSGLGALPAVAVTADLVEQFKERCLELGKAPATVDRYVETLRAAFEYACKKERISRVPKFSLLRPNNRRTGFFEKAEVEVVCGRLRDPLDDVTRFAYLSGWRKGEIVRLRWDQIDRTACEVRLWDSKSGKGRVLPYRASAELTALLERRWEFRRYARPTGPALSALVFHEAGLPVGDFRKSWATACRKAGVGRRLFHDLRRSAVRDMIRAGVPQAIAKAISGHATDSVFDRYNIVDERDKSAALARTESYRAHLPNGVEVSKVSTEFPQRAGLRDSEAETTLGRQS
jgi:integrase